MNGARAGRAIRTLASIEKEALAMPYVAREERQELDSLIDALAERIAERARRQGQDGAFPGLLNYSCTRLGLKVVRALFGPLRYHLIATLTGTFHNVADELYRRVAAPYEDAQIARRGDVDLIESHLEDLREA